MKYIKLFEGRGTTIQKIIDEVIKYEVVFEVTDISSDPVERIEFDEDEYDEALRYYQNNFEYSEGKYKTYTHMKMLSKLTYRVEYEFDSEYEDKYDIEDDDKEWEIIDMDYLESETYKINETSDDLLNEVENWFRGEYNSRSYKYHKIDVYYNEDEYKTIQVRISDHTENIMNNDRFRRVDYYISIVISDYDVTNNRFGMVNSFERRRNEYELRYNSDSDIDQIKMDIENLVKEIEEEIHEIY